MQKIYWDYGEIMDPNCTEQFQNEKKNVSGEPHSDFELCCTESFEFSDEDEEDDFKGEIEEFCGFDLKECYIRMLKTEMKDVVEVPKNLPYLEIRNDIINWVTRESEYMNLKRSVVHLAIRYIDKYLALWRSLPPDLQLLAYCCILLAAKYADADENIPKLSVMFQQSKSTYELFEIKHVEICVMHAFDWKLNVLSPINFLENYIARGCLFDDDEDKQNNQIYHSSSSNYPHADTNQKQYGRKNSLDLRYDFVNTLGEIADLCLRDYSSLQRFRSSVVASSIVLLVRNISGITPVWRPELETLTGYSETLLRKCHSHIWKRYKQTIPSHSRDSSPTSVNEL